MYTHPANAFDPDRSPADGTHQQRWLDVEVRPWPKWYGLTTTAPTHSDTTFQDDGAQHAGWKIRRDKSQRPRKQQPHLDKQYAESLRRYRKHVRARDCVKAFLTAEKVKIPGSARNKPPKFEAPLISLMDQRRYAEIRASMDEEVEDREEEKAKEAELTGSLLDDLVYDFVSLDVKEELVPATASPPEPFRVVNLMKELESQTLSKSLPSSVILQPAALKMANNAEQERAPPAKKTLLPVHTVSATAAFGNGVIKPGFSITPATPTSKAHFASSSLSSHTSAATFDTAPEERNKAVRNPLYANVLSFSKAMSNIIDTLASADKACRYWLRLPEQRAREVMTGTTSAGKPMVRLQRDFEDVCQFLTNGREGWDFTQMPDNFFRDIEVVLESVILHLECLFGYKGCEGLCAEALVTIGLIKGKVFHWKCAKILLDEEDEDNEGCQNAGD